MGFDREKPSTVFGLVRHLIRYKKKIALYTFIAKLQLYKSCTSSKGSYDNAFSEIKNMFIRLQAFG